MRKAASRCGAPRPPSPATSGADRLTLYAVSEDRTAIVSKIKTGLNTAKDLKLPISPQSIAGYVAMSKQLVNIADVYDDEALKKIHPALSFLKEVDKRSGYRTKQMMVVPIQTARVVLTRSMIATLRYSSSLVPPSLLVIVFR